MPKWILRCVKCNFEFEHSQISDVGMSSLFLQPKPQVPPTGIECVCPHCGKTAAYRRTDLLYRA
jgi:hypothetical protein